MNTTSNLISALELRRLLYTIVDNHSGASFRYRVLGEMWQTNFFRVVQITEQGVLLIDELTNSFKSLPDLSQIVQFEIDVAVHGFLAHNHYDVDFCEIVT